MTRDQSVLDAAHRSVADQLCALLDDDLSVAYLCLGDISIYSSYHYLDRLVRERGYETRIIPGVTSFCAAAARLGMPLCLGSERLVVSPAEPGLLDQTLDMPGTKVLMKAGKSFPTLRDRLAQRGKLGQASLVSACGMPEERVYDHIEDAPDDVGYLSLAIVRSEQEVGQGRD